MKKLLFTLIALTSFISNAQWYEQDLVDEFGDPSGSVEQIYITDGSFSNSAAINRGLTVRVRKTEPHAVSKFTVSGYSFALYEYNKHIVRPYKSDTFSWSVKAANGDRIKGYTKGTLSLDKWVNKRGKPGYMASYDNSDLINFIDSHPGKLMFVIYQGSSSYKFTIINDKK